MGRDEFNERLDLLRSVEYGVSGLKLRRGGLEEAYTGMNSYLMGLPSS